MDLSREWTSHLHSLCTRTRWPPFPSDAVSCKHCGMVVSKQGSEQVANCVQGIRASGLQHQPTSFAQTDSRIHAQRSCARAQRHIPRLLARKQQTNKHLKVTWGYWPKVEADACHEACTHDLAGNQRRKKKFQRWRAWEATARWRQQADSSTCARALTHVYTSYKRVCNRSGELAHCTGESGAGRCGVPHGWRRCVG